MISYEIIERFYDRDSTAYFHLVQHGRAVAAKALKMAERVPHLNPDPVFIEEAALLHDIGMIRTHAPQLGCTGSLPYVAHGYLGREMLEELGLMRHALVCERHVGTGLSIAYIQESGLPLPQRDMLPQSIEEQIICVADKFFSKDNHALEKPLSLVREQISRYGADNLLRFDRWIEIFRISR